MRTFLRLFRNKSGATSIEYGVIAALIALGLVAAVNTVGARITDVLASLSAIGDSPRPGNSGNGS